ncbi:hypothetical protein RD1_0976 [Roseobacter denitrificans OCh 114]|uniref:Uncharacterized protein n=1 Tax=Roseobacter denitrificans (strain ATCC 33942 / OCh 114) TaxID=375451 RepID=Q16BK0_ROSDO|nr:hypothetical protein RD1_0976 [Roseobacter denitrificans OCh 114]
MDQAKSFIRAKTSPAVNGVLVVCRAARTVSDIMCKAAPSGALEGAERTVRAEDLIVVGAALGSPVRMGAACAAFLGPVGVVRVSAATTRPTTRGAVPALVTMWAGRGAARFFKSRKTLTACSLLCGCFDAPDIRQSVDACRIC